MQRLSELLHIAPGVTAVIGSGGKTSLLWALAAELDGRVVLATSTRVFPFPGVPTADPKSPEELAALLGRTRVVCCAAPCEKGKLGAPQLPFERIAECADYLLVEADGSHRLPLKAHADHEPALGFDASSLVLVVGASGFGRPVSEVVHRSELFCRRAGIDLSADPDPTASVERVAKVVAAEQLGGTVFLNQVDDEDGFELARAFRSALGRPIVAGSLARGLYRLI